ncbi:hypothetical protein VARIO8X_20168 [Burkholderiales bacterium 8X]|nr:hypothetical protein VARIO8X_20168 [Burkholderiales bacterium 8X]
MPSNLSVFQPSFFDFLDHERARDVQERSNLLGGQLRFMRNQRQRFTGCHAPQHVCQKVERSRRQLEHGCRMPRTIQIKRHIDVIGLRVIQREHQTLMGNRSHLRLFFSGRLQDLTRHGESPANRIEQQRDRKSIRSKRNRRSIRNPVQGP